MAGIQGMASPEQIDPVVKQEVPKASALPEVSSEVDYEALANDVMGSQSSAEVDYEALANDVLGTPAPAEDQGFYDKMKASMGKTEQAILSGAEYAINLPEKILSGALQETAIEKETGKGDLGAGIARGIFKPSEVPDRKGMKINLEKIIPSLKGASVQLPTPKVSSDPYAAFSDTGMPQQDLLSSGKPFDAASASDTLLLASEIMLGDAIVSGARKAPVVAKLVGNSLKDVYDGLKLTKPAGKMEAFANPIAEVSKESAAIKKASDAISSIGVKVPLTANMADPANPAAQEAAKEISKSKIFQDLQQEIGERVVKNISENVPRAFANLADDAATTDDIFATVQKARGATGGKMGELKKQAAKELGNGRLPAPDFQKEVDSILDRLTTNDEANKLYISDQKKHDELVNYVEEISNNLFNSQGRLTFGEWEKIYKGLTNKAESAYKSGAETQHIWGRLRKSLSRSEDGMMAQGLEFVNPQAAEKFIKAKGDYGSIMGAYDEINSMLGKDEIVADSLIKKLFDLESTSPEKASAVFKVLGIENPKMVQDLRGRAYKYFLNEAKVAPSTDNPFGIDFKAFSKKIKDLQGSSPESRNMLDILTGSKENSKNMIAMADVADAFSRGYQGKQKTINENLLGRAFFYMEKIKSGSPKTWFSWIADAMKRDDAFAEALKNVDINELTKAWPPNKRKEAEEFLRKVLK